MFVLSGCVGSMKPDLVRDVSVKNLTQRLFSLVRSRFMFIKPQGALLSGFYTPVERRDVLWNGPVRRSVRPSVHNCLRTRYLENRLSD